MEPRGPAEGDPYPRWLDALEQIKTDIVGMYADRAIWTEIVGMLDANENIEHRDWVRTWLSAQYVTSQAMGVRRQVDRRSDVISIGSVLLELEENSSVLSRDRYFEICGPVDGRHQESVTHRNFDAWAGAGGDVVAPAIVASKRAGLNDAAARVREYVNKRIAHWDRKDPQTFTFGDLDAALDKLGSTLQELELLLRGVSLIRVEPYVQTAWQWAFAVPWLDDQKVRRWRGIKERRRDFD